MLPVFFYGWRGEPLLCYPLHCTWGKCYRFIAMSVDVLDDSLLCCPLHVACLKRCLLWCDEYQRVGRPVAVLPPLHYTSGKCCLFWCDECQRVGRLVAVLPPLTLHLR